MTYKGKISRDRIVEAANRLVYTQGFNQTSFSDVANAVGITKGNLHYHFNSKNDLLESIINYRMELIAKHLDHWEKEFPAPKDRLKRFIKILLNEEQDVAMYGCPMGTLNMELGKSQTVLQNKAQDMFEIYNDWLEKVFRELDRKNSRIRSNHLLAMAQGAAVMSYVYSDAKLLHDEYKIIEAWIDTL